MLFQLFWSFFKIGTFTFGSGYAMIPMIEKEVVERKKWFEKEDFYNQFALAQSAPGPFSLNTAVFVGYRMKGWVGSLAAVLGAVLPSFIIILVIAVFLTGFRDNTYVEAAFKGIRPAVVALIAVPFFRLMKGLKWPFIILAVALAFILWRAKISPIYFLLAAAIAGVAEVLLNNRKK